jgi:peptidyl-prolyl cis-trans isomerase C
VITLNGICADKNAPPANCKTVVTRAQFDQIVSVLNPQGQGLPPGAARTFATRYAQALLLATVAEKEGLDKDPRTQVMLKLARTQALAQVVVLSRQQQALPPAEEVQKYYQENQPKYAQVTARRLFLPSNGGNAGQNDAQKAEAEKLQRRAAAGEDFDKLESEAYKSAGWQNPPPTQLKLRASPSLPPDQQSVFKLNPGEVSQVFSSPAGYSIYKLESKGAVPLSEVKPEIEHELQENRLKTSMDSLLRSGAPVLNDAYFGPPPPQAEPGASAMPNAPEPQKQPRQ